MAAAPSPLGSPAASPPRPAGGPNLLRSAKQQWKSVGLLLNGAAVYLDDGAAEAVGASVGVAFLQSECRLCRRSAGTLLYQKALGRRMCCASAQHIMHPKSVPRVALNFTPLMQPSKGRLSCV